MTARRLITCWYRFGDGESSVLERARNAGLGWDTHGEYWGAVVGSSGAGYVPYVGAVSNLDLGGNSVYADNVALSEGMFTEPTITDASGANIAVTSADVLIRSDATWGNDGKLYRATVPENTSLAVTDNVVNYLYVAWNGGSPVYAVTTDRNALNHSDKVPVARLAIRTGNVEYKLMYGTLAKAAAARNIDRVNHIRGSYGIERESGLTLSETATRVVNISAGYAWFGLNRITLQAVYQGGPGMSSDMHYHVGGVWAEQTMTQYNNTQYDNGTDLVTLTAGRYAVNWIYRNLTKLDIDIVLGRGDYTLAQAEASGIPPLQDETDNFYVLCGRIIVKKGDSTAASVETVSSTAFSRATVSIHNDLSGIQGGTAGEYYHLTAAQLAWLEAQMGA